MYPCVCVHMCVFCMLMYVTYHNAGVSAGANRSGREGVESGTGVELFRAQVVWTVTQSTADGTALIPTKKDHEKEKNAYG